MGSLITKLSRRACGLFGCVALLAIAEPAFAQRATRTADPKAFVLETLGGSARSATGAALGAIVGTGVGLGVHWLLNHSSDRNLGDKIVVPIFVISQGLFAALGSRTVGASR